MLADEEPKYLRRQKPLEIKRRKFGRKAWSTYLRVTVWVVGGAAAAFAAYEAGNFLLFSPEMELIHPDQVALSGNHYMEPSRVLEIFAADRGKSVLRIPLDERRKQLESLPWIEQATVRRSLPNRIEVEIKERAPVAFVRESEDMALIDGHGVILDRPLEGDFHFPVITGIGPDTAADEREKRMQMYSGFAQQIESARAGALDHVSEVDLSDSHDVRATMTGLGGADANAGSPDAPVVVHFGDSNFAEKYETLVDDIAQWRAKAGPVESVDLRFNREAVVNQDLAAAPPPAKHPAAQPPVAKRAAALPASAAKHPSAHPAKRAPKPK